MYGAALWPVTAEKFSFSSRMTMMCFTVAGGVSCAPVALQMVPAGKPPVLPLDEELLAELLPVEPVPVELELDELELPAVEPAPVVPPVDPVADDDELLDVDDVLEADDPVVVEVLV